MIVMLSSLDALFGLRVSFRDLHQWFQRCVLIGGSRTRPPRIALDGLPEEGPYCHRRHEGGREGTGQKIWTLVAQLLIRHSMVLGGLRGSIIGQGDNQVIVLRLTKDHSVRPKAVVQNFLRALRQESAKKNTYLNKTENWYSNSFLEANKDLYYEGVQLVNGLKFACKLDSDENEASNIFATRIASTATIAESMAKRLPSCDVVYALSSFEVITQCSVEGLFPHDKRFHQVMPVWLTAIGGLPVPNYVQLNYARTPRSTNTLSLSIHPNKRP